MALKEGNSVTRACKLSGLSRRTAYYLKAEDVEFADAWEDAIASGIEELEDHLRSRALDKEDKSSAILLMFLLKKLKPQYRENFKPETKKTVEKTPEFEFSKDEVQKAIEILEKAK